MQIDRPIAIAGILFIVLILVFVLVMPEYKAFKKLQMDLAQKKAEYAAAFDYYAAISKAYYDLQARKSDLQKIDDALPPNANIGNLIYSLQRMAAENSMIVKDLFLSKTSSSSQANKSAIKDIVFSMYVQGDYKSLQNFLISLEDSARIFEVTSISFSSPASSSASSQSQFQSQQIYSFNLQLKTQSY